MSPPMPIDYRAARVASLDGWKDNERRGVLQIALTLLAHGIRQSISVAVREAETREAFASIVRELSVPDLLVEHVALEERLVRERPELARWAVGFPSQDSLVAFAHAAWLLDDWETGNRMARHAWDLRQAPKYNPLPVFSEYARGLTALVDRETYDPPALKPKEVGREMLPTLVLISDLAHGRDPTESAARAREAFDSWQRDRRRTDWDGMDGDWSDPVKYAFRLESLRYWAQVQRGVTF